jgi:uncharacterized membrane protein YdbT with pleckstrin-like domain
MEKLVVKKTMAVVMLKFIAMQIFFALCYFAVSLISNSITQFNNGTYINLAAYDSLIFSIIAVFQIIFSLYIFLEWVMEKYSIFPDKIEHQSGIIFRETDSWQINNVETAFIAEGIIARLFGFGTITFHSPTLEEHIVLSNVPSPTSIVAAVEKNLAVLGKSPIKFIKSRNI